MSRKSHLIIIICLFKNNSLNLNKTKLRKMKKNEIIQLINEFNYQVNVNQTKDNLINDILMS